MSPLNIRESFEDRLLSIRNPPRSLCHPSAPFRPLRSSIWAWLKYFVYTRKSVFLPIVPPYCTIPNPCRRFPAPDSIKVPLFSAAFFVKLLITPVSAFEPQLVSTRPRTHYT